MTGTIVGILFAVAIIGGVVIGFGVWAFIMYRRGLLKSKLYKFKSKIISFFDSIKLKCKKCKKV